jgi:DNA processing protein
VNSTPTLTDDQRYGAALAALGASPGVLRKFLHGYQPVEAWEAIARGRHRADPDCRYRGQAVPHTLETVVASCMRTGASVTVLGGPGYPPALAQDRQAPAVLFSTGDLGVLEGRPRVAVVGTRSATPYGLGVAAQLGRDLARAGVVVVSGVALGIDSAAHAGALGVDDGAPTVGVLGTALDTTTTRSQSTLRHALDSRGAVLSEIPPGVHSARWWFAVRNRVMAALAHVVVVVECHHRGGSLHTVAAALARGVTVSAVPGSVRSPASAGTNRLLVEGAVPVRDVDDVLTAVELAIVTRPEITPPRRPSSSACAPPVGGRAGGGRAGGGRAGGGRAGGGRAGGGRAGGGRAASLTPVQRQVRRALDQDPATLEAVVRRSGFPLGDVALALEALADAGLAVGDQGWWSRPRR